MTAYLIIAANISNEMAYAKYRQAVMPLIETFGGRHLRGGEAVKLEGTPSDGKIALFEFPSMDAIRLFWQSPEYAAIKKLRLSSADLHVWSLPGVATV